MGGKPSPLNQQPAVGRGCTPLACRHLVQQAQLVGRLLRQLGCQLLQAGGQAGSRQALPGSRGACRQACRQAGRQACRQAAGRHCPGGVQAWASAPTGDACGGVLPAPAPAPAARQHPPASSARSGTLGQSPLDGRTPRVPHRERQRLPSGSQADEAGAAARASRRSPGSATAWERLPRSATRALCCLACPTGQPAPPPAPPSALAGRQAAAERRSSGGRASGAWLWICPVVAFARVHWKREHACRGAGSSHNFGAHSRERCTSQGSPITCWGSGEWKGINKRGQRQQVA